MFGNFSQQTPILCVYLVFGGLTMAAPMGHLTIKFNSIKFNSLGLLFKYAVGMHFVSNCDNFTRFRCAENHTPQDHFRCVMVCYDTCTPQKTRSD